MSTKHPLPTCRAGSTPWFNRELTAIKTGVARVPLDDNSIRDKPGLNLVAIHFSRYAAETRADKNASASPLFLSAHNRFMKLFQTVHDFLH